MIQTSRHTVKLVLQLIAEGYSQNKAAKVLKLRPYDVWCIVHEKYYLKGGGLKPKMPDPETKKNLFNYKQYPCWITGFGAGERVR